MKKTKFKVTIVKTSDLMPSYLVKYRGQIFGQFTFRAWAQLFKEALIADLEKRNAQ